MKKDDGVSIRFLDDYFDMVVIYFWQLILDENCSIWFLVYLRKSFESFEYTSQKLLKF